MDFFYPNFINDFWRVAGLVFYGSREHFVVPGEKRFDKELVESFCTEKGIALYDTACAVRRLSGNASDKFLEVVEPTDIGMLLEKLPLCTDLAVTGQKASDVLTLGYGLPEPPVGGFKEITLCGRSLRFWRMPSTSRAYPLKLELKAEAYRKLYSASIGVPGLQ